MIFHTFYMIRDWRWLSSIKEEPLTPVNMLINSTELIDIGLFISESKYERDAEEFDLSYNEKDPELFFDSPMPSFL